MNLKKKINRKNRDKIVSVLLMCSIPLDTPQNGGNGKLSKLVVFDGMSSITSHFIPFFFYKTKQWNVAPSHSIPFHSTTHHQSKHSVVLISFKIVMLSVSPKKIMISLFFYLYSTEQEKIISKKKKNRTRKEYGI